MKYSKYAIGEVIIVIIGVLSALFLHNWNEQRKELENFNQSLFRVENELVLNIESARRVLGFYHRIDSLSNVYFFDSIGVDNYEHAIHRPLLTLGMYYPPISIVTDDYLKMLNHNQDLTPSQYSAIVDLKLLYGYYTMMISDIEEVVSRYQREIIDNHVNDSWYSDYYLRNYTDEVVKHLLEDNVHRNKVSISIMNSLGNHARDIHNFEVIARKCYFRIHAYLESACPNQSDPILFTYNTNDHADLIGTYRATWVVGIDTRDDRSINKRADSTVISIENDTLFISSYIGDVRDSKLEIIPTDKSYFRTEGQFGYYQVVYGDSGNVERVDKSKHRYWLKMEKIR